MKLSPALLCLIAAMCLNDLADARVKNGVGEPEAPSKNRKKISRNLQSASISGELPPHISRGLTGISGGVVSLILDAICDFIRFLTFGLVDFCDGGAVSKLLLCNLSV